MLFLILMAPVLVWGATKTAPTVLYTAINPANTNQLVIVGGGFSNSGLAPTVILNNLNLAPLVSFTATRIVAQASIQSEAGRRLSPRQSIRDSRVH
jgi:hypothetical protein